MKLIDLSSVLAFANAESRLSRRLVRYWIFLVIALLLTVVAFARNILLHGLFSTWSVTVGAATNPRFLLAFTGILFAMIWIIGLVFLGFDVRARDERERIWEVLDTRPYATFDMLLGRLLGLIKVSVIPLALMLAMVQIVSMILAKLELPGMPMEPISVLSFFFMSMLPALAFVTALVFLFSIALKNRLLSSIALVLVFGLAFFAVWRLPLWSAAFFDITGVYHADFPSDIISSITAPLGWLQRIAISIASIGILLLASAFHPRRDHRSRAAYLLPGLIVLVVAVGLCSIVAFTIKGQIAEATGRAAAHAEHSGPFVDIESIEGKVDIDPGKALEASYTIALSAPEAVDQIVLSLNPGLELRSASLDGASVEARHESGMILIDRPLEAGSHASLELEIGGVPNQFIGYEDSARDPYQLTAWEGQVFLLGWQPGVFDAKFVALMPGNQWLPRSGPPSGRDRLAERPRDLFELDLEVGIPGDWLVAGPGLRQELGEGRYRFVPGAPLSEVALIAGSFVSRTAVVDGTHLELMLHESHAGVLDELAPAAEPVLEWLTEKLEQARTIGLPYPYDGFTVVEVPQRLRTYGGGARMDSVLGPPGMVLLRESGMPTARWDFMTREPEDFDDTEGGMGKALRDRLELHFVNDYDGGNLFQAAARSFLQHELSPTGPGAEALDAMMNDLVAILLTDRRSYFSPYHFTPDIDQTFFDVITRQDTGGGSSTRGDFSDAVIETFTNRPSVWERASTTALTELDLRDDPRIAVDVLTLKSGTTARMLLDALGPLETGKLLGELRSRHLGDTYDWSDVKAIGLELGHDLDSIIGDWIGSTGMAGFLVDAADLDRIQDEDGQPRYQLKVRVHNAEESPGQVRLEYWLRDDESTDSGSSSGPTIRVNGSRSGGGLGTPNDRSEPYLVPPRGSIEIGLVSSKPITRVRLEPYMSLNRERFAVEVEEVDEDDIVDAEPFRGVRESDWRPGGDGAIIVDDLDPGFALEGEVDSGFRLVGRGEDREMDQGLPAGGRARSRWIRREENAAYGRYRHTAAIIRPTDKPGVAATFSAELPRSGPWNLEIFVPDTSGSGNRRLGDWHIEIIDPSGNNEKPFDGSAAVLGWNDLGTWELAKGTTKVSIGSHGTGGLIWADAIRWTSARPPVANETPVESETQ